MTLDAATEQRARAALLDCQRRVLERTASGAPLLEILETLVKLIEEEMGGMRCAVLLADSAQQKLRFAAAPNIPEDYKAGIEPFLLIAPNMGSCGTAAFRREPMYTRDTADNVLWENWGAIGGEGAEKGGRPGEDLLRLVIDPIPTMAWSLRPDGAVDFVNQRWLEY